MKEETKSQEFHNRAKQAGDQLRAYIVSISVATTGMLFLHLTDSTTTLPTVQKITVAFAIIMMSLTVLFTLAELYLNARRFFEVAKQTESDNPDWSENERLKAVRLKVMWISYLTMVIGIFATLVYMVMSIVMNSPNIPLGR